MLCTIDAHEIVDCASGAMQPVIFLATDAAGKRFSKILLSNDMKEKLHSFLGDSSTDSAKLPLTLGCRNWNNARSSICLARFKLVRNYV